MLRDTFPCGSVLFLFFGSKHITSSSLVDLSGEKSEKIKDIILFYYLITMEQVMEQVNTYVNLLEPCHLAEIVGTFIFLSGILNANGPNATLKLSAALTLSAFIIGDISGGHMNPAVSSMFYLQGKQNQAAHSKLMWYASCQVVGGLLAHTVHTLLNGLPGRNCYSPGHKYSHNLVSACIAEFVGTIIFFIGILSNGGNMFVVGLSLYIAANIAGGVSGGHLNPAVTFMMLVRGEIDIIRASGFIACQLMGAFCTLQLHAKLHE